MNLKQIDFIQNNLAEALDEGLGQLAPLKNKSVYISGGSGFVGKWLIEAINYLNQHHNFNVHVTALSRTIRQQGHLHPQVFNKKHIDLIETDIKGLTTINRDVSYVVHLAASPDNRDHSSDPVKVMNDIFVGTNKALDASTRLDKLTNFLHFSSGLVNGPMPFALDQLQEGNYLGLNCATTNTVYAEAKRSAETLAQGYRSLYKLPLTVLRPFAFIGPYQSIERPWAINNFIRDSLNAQPIRILGDEQTVRSYMYPSEMAYWSLLALANPQSGSVFNLGSSDGKNLRTIAQIVEKNFNNKNGIVTTSLQNTGLLTKFVPSTEKFESMYKVKRKLTTEQAIERAVQWYKLAL